MPCFTAQIVDRQWNKRPGKIEWNRISLGYNGRVLGRPIEWWLLGVTLPEWDKMAIFLGQWITIWLICPDIFQSWITSSINATFSEWSIMISLSRVLGNVPWSLPPNMEIQAWDGPVSLSNEAGQKPVGKGTWRGVYIALQLCDRYPRQVSSYIRVPFNGIKARYVEGYTLPSNSGHPADHC